MVSVKCLGLAHIMSLYCCPEDESNKNSFHTTQYQGRYFINELLNKNLCFEREFLQKLL